MNQINFLRLAFVLSDGQAKTFTKNLLKIIKLILFETFGSPLTISEIIKKASIKYSLDFADSEVKNAILSAPVGEIVETRSSQDSVYFRYSLSPSEYEKMNNKNISDALNPFIEQFLSQHPDKFNLSSEEFKEIVYKFLYQCFNSDKQTVLALMNYTFNPSTLSENSKILSSEEIDALNSFLNWPNTDKNELIFRYVSFCYDYCVMTLKKDSSIYQSIFKGKEFYLDANIIFRLAGFNKLERKDAATSFLNKCVECGIKIKYTNFTNYEIDTTIDYYIGNIKKLLNGKAPICTEAMRELSSKYSNMDFYEQYYSWTQSPLNRANDYAAFAVYLKRQISEITKQMSMSSFETFDTSRNSERFKACFDELTAFKCTKNKGTYEGSIKTDVENYLVIKQLTKDSRATSFFDEKFFFITADHAYIDWTREKNPGAVPLFVLPSVWYSIMLKYHGRTDNDYAAFCQFLNQRITIPPDSYEQEKLEILTHILNLNESSEIKEEIIFDIKQKLAEPHNNIDNVEEFVIEVHNNVTARHIEQAITETKEQLAEDKNTALREASELAQIEKEQAYNEGFNKGKADAIEAQARRIVKRNTIIKIWLTTVSVIALLSLIFVIFIQSFNKGKTSIVFLTFFNNNQGLCSILTLLLSLLRPMFVFLGKYFPILSTNIETVTNRLIK